MAFVYGHPFDPEYLRALAVGQFYAESPLIITHRYPTYPAIKAYAQPPISTRPAAEKRKTKKNNCQISQDQISDIGCKNTCHCSLCHPNKNKNKNNKNYAKFNNSEHDNSEYVCNDPRHISWPKSEMRRTPDPIIPPPVPSRVSLAKGSKPPIRASKDLYQTVSHLTEREKKIYESLTISPDWFYGVNGELQFLN